MRYLIDQAKPRSDVVDVARRLEMFNHFEESPTWFDTV